MYIHICIFVDVNKHGLIQRDSQKYNFLSNRKYIKTLNKKLIIWLNSKNIHTHNITQTDQVIVKNINVYTYLSMCVRTINENEKGGHEFKQ